MASRLPNFGNTRTAFSALALLAVSVLFIFAAESAQAAAAKKAGGGGGGGGGHIGTTGTVELGLKGLLNLDASEATAVYADLTLGYFPMTGVELGMTALIGTTPNGQRDTYGLFGEYELITIGSFSPYVGLSVKHAAPPRGGNKDGKIYTGIAGMNLGVASNVALSLSFNYAVADRSVLGAEAHHTRRDESLDVGFRVFF